MCSASGRGSLRRAPRASRESGSEAEAPTMADDTPRPPTSTGDTRPAAGAMNPAFGRTSRDLASDEPAGFGPDPIAGADARDTFSDPDDPGRAERLGGKPRKFNPDIPPDARLGL